MTTPHFAFVDIETTGLNFLTDQILEVGIIATDDMLNRIASVEVVLAIDEGRVLSDFIKDMHGGNSLLVYAADHGMEKSAAEAVLVEWMLNIFGEEKPAMCGSGVHFDRRFLADHMPQLHDCFHYRNMDLSTTKRQIEKWCNPEVAAQMPQGYGVHRAIDDCEDAIELARFAKALFLHVPVLDYTPAS
ncbi:MAG: oligoribonuclease [Porticoccaceae bacterium]